MKDDDDWWWWLMQMVIDDLVVVSIQARLQGVYSSFSPSFFFLVVPPFPCLAALQTARPSVGWTRSAPSSFSPWHQTGTRPASPTPPCPPPHRVARGTFKKNKGNRRRDVPTTTPMASAAITTTTATMTTMNHDPRQRKRGFH